MSFLNQRKGKQKYVVGRVLNLGPLALKSDALPIALIKNTIIYSITCTKLTEGDRLSSTDSASPSEKLPRNSNSLVFSILKKNTISCSIQTLLKSNMVKNFKCFILRSPIQRIDDLKQLTRNGTVPPNVQRRRTQIRLHENAVLT